MKTFIKVLKKTLKYAQHEYRIMQCKYRLRYDWEDDLIWCPSQCYKKIEYKGRQFVIYLLWRHADPWTATLIECFPDGKFERLHSLNVSPWKDSELDKLKKEVEWHVKDWLVRNV